jgi:hypothetical protein
MHPVEIKEGMQLKKLAIVNECGRLLAACDNGFASWNLTQPTEAGSELKLEKLSSFNDTQPDDHYILCQTGKESIEIHYVNQKTDRLELPSPQPEVRCCDYQKKRLIYINSQNQIEIFDVIRKETQLKFLHQLEQISFLKVYEKSDEIIVSFYDCNGWGLALFDLETGIKKRQMQIEKTFVNDFDYTTRG